MYPKTCNIVNSSDVRVPKSDMQAYKQASCTSANVEVSYEGVDVVIKTLQIFPPN